MGYETDTGPGTALLSVPNPKKLPMGGLLSVGPRASLIMVFIIPGRDTGHWALRGSSPSLLCIIAFSGQNGDLQ